MIALDPNQTFGITFDEDADKPPEHRTALIVRFATARQYLDIKTLVTDADADGLDAVKRLDLLANAIAIVAVKWRRPDGDDAFDREKLRDLLTVDEFWNIVGKILSDSRAVESERKKSVLQSASVAATKSANSAQAAGV